MTDLPAPQPPGWYQGEGDPPGTQRYWNGAAWVGQARPMAAGPDGPGGVVQFASWWSRAGAFLLDTVVQGAVAFVFFLFASLLGRVSDPAAGIGMVVAIIALVALQIYNYCFLQSWNGATVGKRVVGIAVVRDRGHETLPPGRLFGRWLMTSLLGLLFYIGMVLDYLWPFWDKKNQTIHDKVVGSIVVTARSLPERVVPANWSEYRFRPSVSTAAPAQGSRHSGP
ncbi:MAG: RDD family protein [Actinomycetia bacterium]|nr:RDD family protein [Actinomycetes bacterium]